jgi:hypothetical protein
MLKMCTPPRANHFVISLLLLVFSTTAVAQQSPSGQSVGIVTAIQGQAAVSRVSLPQPESLHFKDDVFYRDQIATRERSTVRLLLGGKGTLTIREQSHVTLDESVAPDGARQSVISILTGKIAAAIAHALMRPGDVIEIRTPNAVAAVRGTVLIAEYIPPKGSAATDRPALLASAGSGPVLAQASGMGGVSNFLVISGQITITLQGQPPITLDTLQSVSITETAAGLQTGPIQNVTPAQAADSVKDLQVNRPDMGNTVSSKVAESQTQIAAAVANVIIQNTTSQAVAAASPITTTSPISTISSSTTTTATSVTPPPTAPESSSSTQTSSAVSSGSEGGTVGTSNTLPSGSLLTLSDANVALADGTSVATFSAGKANSITPITLSGAGTVTPSGTPLTVTGDPITHSGPIVTLDPSTLNGATGPAEAPLVIVNGTTLTNSGGPVFDVTNSFVSAFWPVLQLAPGANATVAGVMNIAGTSKVSVGPHDAVSLQSGSTLTSTDALFRVGGNSVLLTTGGAALVGVGSGTLTLQAPILSATGNSGISLSGPALHAADSTVTSTQPLVLLQGTSTLTSTGPLVLMNGGSLTADSILAARGTPSITLGGAFLAQSGGTVTTGADALAVGSQTLTSGATPVFALTGGTLITQNGGHLVSLNGGSLTLGGPLLTLGMGPAEQTPTVTIAGDVLHVASTVTSPTSGSLIDVSAGSLSAAGDLASLQAESAVTLHGPVLSVSGTGSVAAGNVLSLGAPLTTPSGQSLLQVIGGKLTTSGSLASLGADLTLQGAFLAQSGGTVTTGADALAVGSQTLSSGAAAVFSLTGGSLTTQNGSHLVSLSGGTTNLGGPLLSLPTGTPTVTIAGDVLHVASTVTGPPSGRLVDVSAGSLMAMGDLVNLGPEATLTLSGGVLTLNGGNVAVGNVLNVAAPVTSPSGQPVVQVTGGTLTTTGALTTLGANLTLGGAFLAQSGGTVTTGADALAVGSQTLTSGATPVFALTGGTLITQNGGHLVSLNGGSLTLGGPLLTLGMGPAEQTPTVTIAGDVLHVASTVTGPTSGSLIDVSAGSLSATGGLVNLGTGSTLSLSGPMLTVNSASVSPGASVLKSAGSVIAVSTNSPLMTLSNRASLTAGGPVLDLTNSPLNLGGQPLVSLTSGSTLANTVGPVIKISGGSLAADALAKTDGTGNTFNLTGNLLDLINTMVTLRVMADQPPVSTDSITQSLPVGEPMIRMTNSNLTLTGVGERLLDPGSNTQSTVDGLGLVATSSTGNTISLAGPLLRLSGFTFTATDPYIQLTNMTVSQTGSDSLIQVDTSFPATVNGPLLVGTGSIISTGANLFLVSAQLSSKTTQPLIQLDPSNVTAGVSIVQVSGGQLNLAGPLLAVTSSTLNSGTSGAFVSVNTGGQLIGNDSSGNGLLSFSTSKVNGGSNFFEVRGGGSQVALAGPLVTDEGSTFTLSNQFLQIRDGASLTSTSSGPLISMSGSTFTGGDPETNRGGSLLHMFSLNGTAGTSVNLQGSLLSASNSTFTTTDGNFVNIRDGASLAVTLTGAPFLSLTSSKVTASSNVIRFSPDGTDSAGIPGSKALVTVSLSGPLLNATDTQFTANAGGFLGLHNQATLTASGGEVTLMSLNGTAPGLSTVGTPASNFLYLSAAAETTPPSLSLTNPSGRLLDATNTTIATGDPSTNNFSFMFVGDGATLRSAGTGPLVTFTNSSLTTSGAFLSVRRSGTGTSTVNLAGPLLSASDSSFTTSSSVIAGGCCSFLFVGEGGTLQGTGSDALLQFNNSTFPNIGGSFVNLTPTANLADSTLGPSTMTLAGPLLNDSGSTFTMAGSFLRVRDGSTLSYTSTSPAPPALLQFSGSTVGMNGNLFNLGSGVGQPGSTATLAGPLLSATKSTFDSGPLSNFVNVNDGATFRSTTTDPLLSLSGDSITTKAFLARVGLDSSSTSTPTGSEDPVSMTLAGPLLSGTDTSISAISGVLGIRDRATFKSTTTAPLIQIGGTAGSTLTLGGLDPDPASPTFGQQVNSRVLDVQPTLTTPFAASAELFGPLLSATNTTISTTDRIVSVFAQNGASATLTSHTTDPLVELTGGKVTMSGTFYPPTISSSGTTTDTSGSFLRMSSPDPKAPSTVTLAGSLLSASGTTFSGQNHFLRFDQNSQFTGTGEGALVDLSGLTLSTSGVETFVPTSGSTTITTFGEFGRVQGPGTNVSLAGDFLDVQNSNITLAGHFLRLQASAPTITIAGSLLNATNSTLKNGDPTANANSFIFVGDSAELKSTGTLPLLLFDASSVDTAGNILTLRRSNSAGAPSKVTLSGALLAATNNSSFNTTTLGNPAGACCNGFFVGQGAQLTSTTTSPLIQLTNSTFNAGPDAQSGGNLFGVTDTGAFSGETNTLVAPSSVSLAGPLLSATDSRITALFNLLSVSNSSLTSTSTDPLIQLGGEAGTTITLGGTRTDPLSPGSTAFGQLLTMTGSSSTPAVVSLQGPLLQMTNGTINATSGALGIFARASLASATSDPFVQLIGGSVLMSGMSTSIGPGGTTTNTTGNFLSMSSPVPANPATLTLGGPLLSATGTNISGQNQFLGVGDNTALTSTGTAPLIQLSSSPLTVVGTTTFTPTVGTPSTWNYGSVLNACCSNTAVTLAGPLLSAANSDIQAAQGVISITARTGGTSVAVSSTTADPFVRLSGGTLVLAGTSQPFAVSGGTNTSTTGNILGMGSPDPTAPTTFSLAGPLLQAANTAISSESFPLSLGSNASVRSTGTVPLIQLTNSSLTVVATTTFTPSGEGTPSVSTNGIFLNIDGSNAAVTLAGPLLTATDSALSLAGSLVHTANGGRLTSTTTDPLIAMTGGTHSFGYATGVTPPPLLDLHGVNTDALGVGSDPVLQTGGPIIQTNGATVNLLPNVAPAIFLDTALVAAAGPIINLINNSTMNTSANGAGLMNLYQSNVTSKEVVKLDNSVLTVSNGPLLTLTGGSQMTVTADFASLFNGSKLTVLKGPLISVDGVNSRGTPSTLTVSGALVNFGGTGGNQVIINNNISPTATLSGIPVNTASTAPGNPVGSISIGPNPIKNPSLGTIISINPLTGLPASVIRATNGGTVTIKAP